MFLELPTTVKHIKIKLYKTSKKYKLKNQKEFKTNNLFPTKLELIQKMV